MSAVGETTAKNVWTCRSSMSGLFEATGGGISGSQHGIFARNLGTCVPNARTMQRLPNARKKFNPYTQRLQFVLGRDVRMAESKSV